jgi:outer membrane protein assembly factor BamE (lipoprotein component of BamABCDE complex)
VHLFKKEGVNVMRLVLMWAAVLSCVFISGCATTQTQPVTTRNSELTHGNVQLNVKKGETTQTQVLEVFGAPNITSIDSSGQEVWTYQRHASVAQSSSSGNYWTVVLAGGTTSAAGFEQTQRTMTLIIKFDEQKVVSDFRSRSSEF